jgi:hypothetical protein
MPSSLPRAGLGLVALALLVSLRATAPPAAQASAPFVRRVQSDRIVGCPLFEVASAEHARSIEGIGRVWLGDGGLHVEVPLAPEQAALVSRGARAWRPGQGDAGRVVDVRPPVLETGSEGVAVIELAGLVAPLGARVAIGIEAAGVRGAALPWSALVHLGDQDQVVVVRRRLPNGEVELERRRVVVERAGDGTRAVVTHGLAGGEHILAGGVRPIAEQI